MRRLVFLCALVWALGALAPAAALAHGLAGKRFFPATLATDDPFVSDELSLPTIQRLRVPATAANPPTPHPAFSPALPNPLRRARPQTPRPDALPGDARASGNSTPRCLNGDSRSSTACSSPSPSCATWGSRRRSTG